VRLAHAGASRELLGVHPSSLIGENASIAPGARIGPFCVVSDDAVIGPNCELGAGVHILGATTLGADCVVRSHAVVGSPEPGTTVLGHGNVVGAHAVVGAVCADKKHAPALASHLVIGDGNDIREHAQIHRSSGPDTVTKIGSG
jgi:UDP-N-acetylglucosamine acyltransferase